MTNQPGPDNPRTGSYATNFPEPDSLQKSQIYPGMRSFHTKEHCTHSRNGTPAHAITNHR